MLKTSLGSHKGYELREYVEAQTYELDDLLGNCFLTMGVAKMADDAKESNEPPKTLSEKEIIEKTKAEKPLDNKSEDKLIKNKQVK